MPPVWFAWPVNGCQRSQSQQFLKSPAYAEPEHALFLVEPERKSIDNLVLASVWIISINEAKRHVENRNLEANLGAHAAAKVRKLRKQTLVQAHHSVPLRFAAQENLL